MKYLQKILGTSLVLSAFFFYASPALAAISFDNATSVNDGIFSTLTATLTVGSSANRVVFACVEGTIQTSDRITGVTYTKGATQVAMTLIAHTQGASGRWISLWYGINPDSGSNSIIAASSPTDIIGIAAASYAGVNQSMQYIPTATDASTTGSFSGAPVAQSVTTIQNNSWAILCVHGANLTAGANTTVRVANSNGYGIADTNAPVTPAGSVTLNSGASSNWSVDMASFSPVVSITVLGNSIVTIMSQTIIKYFTFIK